jgi:hypothetical protein
MYEFKESDWKLFRQKLPAWRENFMARLCAEYVDLLRSDALPSARFRGLDKRVRKDVRKTVAFGDLSRSRMLMAIGRLLADGVISRSDLDGFSEDLRQTLSGWQALFNPPDSLAE